MPDSLRTAYQQSTQYRRAGSAAFGQDIIFVLHAASVSHGVSQSATTPRVPGVRPTLYKGGTLASSCTSPYQGAPLPLRRMRHVIRQIVSISLLCGSPRLMALLHLGEEELTDWLPLETPCSGIPDLTERASSDPAGPVEEHKTPPSHFQCPRRRRRQCRTGRERPTIFSNCLIPRTRTPPSTGTGSFRWLILW